MDPHRREMMVLTAITHGRPPVPKLEIRTSWEQRLVRAAVSKNVHLNSICPVEMREGSLDNEQNTASIVIEPKFQPNICREIRVAVSHYWLRLFWRLASYCFSPSSNPRRV